MSALLFLALQAEPKILRLVYSCCISELHKLYVQSMVYILPHHYLTESECHKTPTTETKYLCLIERNCIKASAPISIIALMPYIK